MPVSDRRIRIAGSTLLGVFARCTEELVLVPLETNEATRSIVEEGLGVKAVPLVIGGSSVVGSLTCGNATGFVTTPLASDSALKELSKHGRASRLPGRISAAGNVVLANDSAALVHPGLSNRAVEIITRTLDVDVVRGTIGGLKTVGMAGVVTNNGVLVHPKTSEEEMAVLDKLFGLPIDVGTINFGSPLVGSGILANSKGYLTGADTSGPELGRIEDALGYLK